MKQNLRLLLLTLLCAVVTGVWGQVKTTDTYTFTSKDWKATPSDWTSGKNGNGFTDGQGVQVTTGTSGANATLGKSLTGISKIVVTYNTNKTAGKGSIAIKVGNKEFSNDVEYVIGTADGRSANFTTEFSIDNLEGDVTLTTTVTTNSIWVKSIAITYMKEASSAPVFSPEPGAVVAGTTITCTTETEDATIYYTTDGSTPDEDSDEFPAAGVEITEATTFKAIAIDAAGNSSEVTTAAYTITSPITIALARAKADGEEVFTKGIVTSCVGTTAYIQDETAGICVYGKSLTVGDEITVQGKLSTYKGLLEITNPTCTVLSSNNTVTPAVKKVSEISNEIQGILVKIEEAEVTVIDGQNTTIKQEGSSIIVRGITGVTLTVGNIITLTGNVGCYDNPQIANPTNITVKENEKPIITLNSAAIAVAAEGETKTVDVTYSSFTPHDTEVVFYASDGETTTSYDWITTDTDEEIQLIVAANTGEERKAYFKVHSLDDDDNDVYSDLATLTQEAYKEPAAEFASLPFAFNGGKADIENKDGLTHNGLGTDYSPSSNPTTILKFDTTGDWLLLQFDERPGTLTFDIKDNGFSGGTFKVQTSEDGETFTDLQTYTELSGTNSQKFNNLGEDVRYIKWIYTEKSSGNVGLGNIVLEKYEEPTTHTLTISEVENATITAYDEDGDEIASGDEVMAGANVTLTVDIEDGYEVKSISVSEEDGSDVIVTENTSDGSWTFAMPSSNVTVTCTVATATIYTSNIYEKVTSNDDLTSGTYLIVYEEGSLAFDGSLETLDAEGNTIEVIIQDNKIEGSDVIDAATFTIDINEEGNTIQSASGYFIGQTRDANGMLSSATTEYTNTISINGDGGADIVSEGGAYLRYNAASNAERFRYYRSTTYTAQKAIQLYKLVSQEAVPVELTIGTIGYSTLYYSNKALVVPEGVVAKTFKLNDAGTDVVVSTLYEKDEVIPADCGVVIEAIEKGKEQDFTFDVAQTEATPDPDNLLLGLDEGGQTVGPDGDTEGYIFYMLSTKNGNVGFYWKHGGAPFETIAHKAYLAIPKESGVNISSFVFDDLNGITAITNNSTEGAEDVYTLSGMRMDSKQLPKGIYIVNGKKMVIK